MTFLLVTWLTYNSNDILESGCSEDFFRLHGLASMCNDQLGPFGHHTCCLRGPRYIRKAMKRKLYELPCPRHPTCEFMHFQHVEANACSMLDCLCKDALRQGIVVQETARRTCLDGDGPPRSPRISSSIASDACSLTLAGFLL